MTKRDESVRIYDAFLFNDELDMLEVSCSAQYAGFDDLFRAKM